MFYASPYGRVMNSLPDKSDAIQEVGRQIADLEESLRFQKVIKLEQGALYWVLNGATEHKAFFLRGNLLAVR